MESGGYRIVDQYATYFLTFTVVGWIDIFTRKECKTLMLESLKYCQERKGLLLYAYVIMESHVHLIASAHQKTSGISNIIRDLKQFTSKEIINWVQNNKLESRRDWIELVFKHHGKYNSNNTTYQVWQQNNCPKICVLPEFTWQKINYIHYNPVNAGIVDHPVDYKFSSARNYAGRDDFMLDVIVLDYGSQVGFVS